VSGHNSWLEPGALLAGFCVVLVAAMHYIGVMNVNFRAMLKGYWWLSVAVAGVTVMLQERTTGLYEVE